MKHPALVIGQVQKWSMVVIYDKQTGEVLHTHQCVTWPGGKHPEPRALERDAREAMRRAAPERASNTSRLALLHVNPRSIRPDMHYRVDPKGRALRPVSMRELTAKPRA